MNFTQTVSNYCCRRRAIMSRLVPVLLQIILIVVIWKIVKSQMAVKNDVTDVSKRDVQNVAPNEPSRCLFAEFSRAQLLRLFNVSSILSSSKSPQHHDEGNKTPHLLVDVYVRDPQKGTVIFYPAGTPVNTDGSTNSKVDAKKDDVRYDYGNDFLNYDARGEKNAQNANDKTAIYMDSNPNQLPVNKAVFPQGVKDDGEFQYDLGNMPNQHRDSVGRQINGDTDSALNQNLIPRAGFGGHQAQETGLGGARNDGIIKSQNSLGEANQHPRQQPYQNAGPLVNRNNFNEQGSSNDKQNLQQAASGNVFQRNEGLRFDAQGYQNPNRNPVQIGDNQLSYPNMHKSPDIQQNLDGQSDIQQWRGAGSNIQQNRQLPSQGQNWDAAGAGLQIQSPNMAVPVHGNAEAVLTEGYLDRAKKFITELRGKLPDGGASETGPQPILLHMNNPQACQRLRQIHLLYLVNSKPQSSDLRQRIRDTFVKSSYFQPSVVVHVFLVGKTSSPNFQQSLNQEQQQYGDIVQGDFVDVPENATYKGLMGMRWVTQFCPQAQYIMIINEDVFVDTDKLIHGLIPATTKVGSDRVMLCFFNPESPITRSGPNAVSEHLFPGRTSLRPYCKGFAILATRGVIFSLLAASEHAPMIPLDELYLYGILPFISGGIDVFDVGNKRAFNNFGMETVACYEKQEDKCQFVASLAFSERFTTLWEIAKSRMQRMQETHQGWADGQSLWNIPSYVRKF